MGGNVSVSSQDETLVFRGWDAAHIVLPGGTCCFLFCQGNMAYAVILKAYLKCTR